MKFHYIGILFLFLCTIDANVSIASSHARKTEAKMFAAPTFGSTAITSATEDIIYTYNISASDIDGDAVEIDATTLPAWLSFTDNGGGSAVLTGTPVNSNVGLHDVILEASAAGDTVMQSFTITVTNVNDDPVLDPISDVVISEGNVFSITAIANDVDLPAQTMIFSLLGTPPTGASITSGGAFSWTPNESDGGANYIIEVNVNDGDGGTDTVSFTITVNEVNTPPVLTPIGSKSVDENNSLLFTVSASDSDEPINTIVFTLDAASITAGMSISSSTGDFSWTPTEAQGGFDYNVTVTATDNGAPSAESTIEDIVITVNDINEAPILNNIGNQSIDENATLSINVDATDIDDPVNTLSFSLDLNSESLGMAINPVSGAFSWTPNESHGNITPYSVTVTVEDDYAGGNLNDSETFQITVNELNNQPTLAFIGSRSGVEFGLVSFTASATDTDIPSNSIAYSLDVNSIGQGMSIGSSSGDFSWIPNESHGGGSFNVTVTATDNGSPAGNDSETFSITIDETNETPLLVPIGNKTVDEKNQLNFTVEASDSDIPANELIYSLDATSVFNGMSINATSGAFQWTPNESQGGVIYNVVVTVTDNGVPESKSIFETIQITVIDINDAPVLDIIGDRVIDETLTLSFSNNAVDSDDPLDVLSFSLDNASILAGMLINSSSGAFSWTPSESQGGSAYNVTITVTDNGSPNKSDFETFTITVNEVNVSPALDFLNNQTVDELTSLNFTATASDNDLPINALTYSLDASSLGRGMSINSNSGEFSWTPGESEGGMNYDVTITVNDGAGGNDFKTFKIFITDTNIAPQLSSISNKVIDENINLSFPNNATDPDLPVNTLTYSLDGTSIGLGMNINSTDGQFSWTPGESDGGADYVVEISVDDGALGVDTKSFTITVSDTNDPPMLNPIGNKTSSELALLNFTANATDSDIPSNTLTFTLGSGAPTGASISASGVFNWTPSESQGPGTFPVTVIVTDNGAGILNDQETFNIIVEEVNTAPVLDNISDIVVSEGDLISLTAIANDSDLPSNTLTFSLVGSVPAGATISSSGLFTWTPSESQGGSTYTIAVEVSDGIGDDLEIFIITVNEVNEAPVLNAIGDKTANEFAELAFTVTSTDTDTPANSFTYSIDATSQGRGLSMSPSGNFSWTPSEFDGGNNYLVTVTVEDNGIPILSDSEFFFININETNSEPILDFIGSQLGEENSLISFTVNATDSDSPSNNITYSLGGTPPGNASINSSSGAFTWTPVEGDAVNTPFNIEFIATDNGVGNLSDSEIVVFNLNPDNQSPVLSNISNQTVDELVNLTFTASASDPDIPADAISFSLGGTPPTGASINASSGVFNWIPTEAQGGAIYPVTIVATDDGIPNLDANQTINITVNDINVNPVLGAIGDKTVDEFSVLTFTATATDSDLPADNLVFSIDQASIDLGMSMSLGGGFNWTPDESHGGSLYDVVVSVTDDGVGLLTDQTTIQITVNEINANPVLGLLNDQIIDEKVQLTFTANVSDSDSPSNDLVFSLDSGAPVGAIIDPTSGLFSWIPTENQGPGIYPVTVRVTDNGIPSKNDFKEIQITVNDINEPPTLNAIGNKTITEQMQLSFTVSGSDTDVPVQLLTYSLGAGSPSGASIDVNSGLFEWTPTESQGPASYDITILVTDDGAGLLNDSETINIIVSESNIAPDFSTIGNKNIEELQTLSFNVLATDADIPANTLSYSLTGAIPTGASINSSSGQFNWTPTESQGPGTYIFSVEVTDDGSPIKSKSELIEVTVSEKNNPPNLNPIGNKSVSEETPLSFSATASDVDIPSNNLTFSLGSGSPAGATISSAGFFSWTPTESQGPQIYPITIIVSDGNLSDSEIITITVDEVNNPPVLSTITDKIVNELATLSFMAIVSDIDLPSNTQTFSLALSQPGASIDPNTGFFTWTPSESQGGEVYSLAIRVSDGTADDVEFFDVTVNDINLSPIMSSIGNKTVSELQTLSFSALASDSDIPTDNLTFTINSEASTLGMNMTTGGSFSWVPSESQGGSNYSVTITVEDDGNPIRFDSETITITVNDVNVAPVLGFIGNRSVDELENINFTITASDSDIPTNILSFSIDGTIPTGATLNSSTGVFNWTPSEAQGPGIYSITVKVTDNGIGALTDLETFDITVKDINTPPVLASIGNKSASEMALITFTATATDTDIPTNTLSYSLTSGPPVGAIINSTSGLFTWTPSESQGGMSYNFGIRVSDGTSEDIEIITIVVSEINSTPILNVIGNKAVDENASLSFVATSSDSDLPQNTLSYDLDATSKSLGMTITSGGVFSWIPNESQGGAVFNVTISVNDDGVPIRSDSETIQITVNDINTSPQLSFIGNQSGDELTLITFEASASDLDLPADNLTFSLTGTIPSGAAIDPSTGVFTWTPTEAQGAASPFLMTVVVTDNGNPNLSDSETIEIILNSVNVPPVLQNISNKSVNELEDLTFTATASDSDIPANILTFSLGGTPPLGASIHPSTGIFSWTPSEDQGGNVYTIAVVVTDDGEGALSNSKSFDVTVNDVNLPPILVSIGNKNVNELSRLSFTASASDTDLPAQVLTYSLGAGAPAGASISPTTGLFDWTPTESQGPATYEVIIVITDDGNGLLSDSETITITVNELNVAPYFADIGNRTLEELTTLAFNVSATDVDLPPNILTYSLSGSVPAGATLNSGSGQFSWTPSEAQGPGIFSFTVTVTDNGSPVKSRSETIQVTVSEKNNPPVLNPIGNKTVDEQTLTSFSVSASDPDLPANTLTFSLGSGAPSGASITAAGLFSWTPTESQGPAIYPISVIVSDGVLTDVELIEVSVVEVNKEPSLAAISDKTVNELETLSFTATVSDDDIPINTQTFSMALTQQGATIDPNTGVFTWTPNESQGGAVYSLAIKVSDGVADDFEFFDVTVNDVNLNPILSPVGNKNVAELQSLSFSALASDSDIPSDNLSFSLNSAALALGMNITAGGNFSWVPSEAQGGSIYSATIIVKDDGNPILSDSETIMINVADINIAPTLNFIGNKSVNELENLNFIVSAVDSDLPTNNLSFSSEGTLPTGATLNSNTGVFNWTPTETQGPGMYSITIRVTDNGIGSLSDFETFEILVNDINTPPVLNAIGNKSGSEMSNITFTASATDSDLPANLLSFSLTSGPPEGATINASSGVFNWTPSETQGGSSYNFGVRVSDGNAEDIELITISVNEVNSTPVLNLIGNKTTVENTNLSFSVTAMDTDQPQNNLNYDLDNTSKSIGMMITSGGVFSWTPSENQGGFIYNVTITVSDDGSPVKSDSETIQISVNDVNSNPELTFIGNQSGDELTLITFDAIASDSDIPSNNLTFSLSGSIPTGASIDPVSGVFSWTPTELQGASSPYSLTVTVTDDGNPNLSDSETIQIFLNSVNVPPVLESIPNKTVNELSTISFNAVATDSDIPANNLTFSLGGSPPVGVMINPSTGAFVWTPSEEQGGRVYSITIVVTDDGEGSLSNSKSFSVTVNDVNLSPILASIGNKTVNELNMVSFTSTANDTDLPMNNITYTLEGSIPTGAIINPTSGEFSWIPSESQGGTSYTLTIKATDDGVGNLSDSENIQITVIDVNLAPVLSSIGNKSLNENELLSFTASASDSDIPVDNLTFSLLSAPAGASIDPNSGLFTWTPNESQDGENTFTIRVFDGELFGSETITVDVAEVNTAPTITTIGNQTIDELEFLTFQVNVTDIDLPSNSLTYTLEGSVPSGASIGVNSGIFSWTPTEEQGGNTYSFGIRVSDDGAGTLSDVENIEVVVNDLNSAPLIATIGNKSVQELTTLEFIIDATDSDIPVNNLSFSFTGSVPDGVSLDANSGVFNWTPTEEQSEESYQITVVVTDDGVGNLSDTEVFTVNVIGVNTPPELSPIGNKVIDEHSNLMFKVLASDSDIPVQDLVYSLANAVPTGASIDSSTGEFNWQPSENQGGQVAFEITIEVTDGLLRDSETIFVTVNEINENPIIANVDDKVVDEQALITFSVSASDVDVPMNVLTYSLDASAPEGASIDPESGLFSWTPTESQGGVDYGITAIVTDDGLGMLQDSKSINIRVVEVNEAPVLELIESQFTAEETILSFTAMASDSDLPIQTLTFSLGGTPPNGASIDPVSGVFTWTPTQSQASVGTFDIEAVVRDEGGLSDSQTFKVFIDVVSEPPTFTFNPPLNATVGIDYIYNISVEDPDIDDVILIESTELPAWLTLENVSNKTAKLFGQPTTDDIGDHLVSLIATDQFDLFAVQEFVITVSKGQSVDPPVLQTIIKSGRANRTLAFSKEDFTNAFIDADQDELVFVQFESLPTNGELLVDGTPVFFRQNIPSDSLDLLTYQPDNNFVGSDVIRWNASDGLFLAFVESAIAISITEPENVNLSIYSGFTPNGDGANDTWIIDYKTDDGFISNDLSVLQNPIKVIVFDQNGERVFETNIYDNNNPWDGYFRNKELPMGSYYYIIDTNNNQPLLKGVITILR